MALEIYTYGSGSYVTEVFHFIKMFMGSGSFSSLVRLVGIIGLLWVLLSGLRTKSGGVMLDWTWIIFFAFFYGVLLVPKVDVVIVDEIDPPTASSPVVDNVPLGVGFLAYVTSNVGRGLVNGYETFITIPGDQKYSENGMLFGSQVMRTLGETSFPDAGFATDMSEFIQKCVFPRISNKTLLISTIATSKDLWADFLSNSSKNRWLRLNDSMTVMTCFDAAAHLQNRMAGQVNDAAGSAGQRLWPNKTFSDAQATFLASAGGGTANDFLGVTQNAADLTRQAMMIGAVGNALGSASVDSGNDSMAQSVFQAKAEVQQRNMYLTLGSMAARTLPVMRAILEAVGYALAPIVMLMVLMPNGMAAFGQYAMFLFWLQLWPVLYAIINSIMYWYGAAQSVNAALASDKTAGLALETMNSVFSANADLVALAGFLCTLIPMIAYMLLKGGVSSASGLASSMMQPTSNAASTAATEKTSGALAMNTLTMDNASFNNMNANKLDTNSGMAFGLNSTTDPTTGSVTTTTSTGASFTEQAKNNWAFGTQMADAVKSSVASSAKSAWSAAETSAVSFASASTDLFSKMDNFSHSLQRSNALTDSSSRQMSSNLSNSIDNMRSAGAELSSRTGLNLGESLGLLANVGMGILGKGGVDAKSDKNYADAKSIAERTGFSENLATAKQLSQQLAATHSDAVGDQTAQQLQTSIQNTNTLGTTAAAQYQRAQSMEQVKTRIDENGLTLSGEMGNHIMRALGIDSQTYGQVQFAAGQGDAGALNQLQTWVGQFVDEGHAAKLVGLQGTPPTNIGGFYQNAVDNVKSQETGSLNAMGGQQIAAARQNAGFDLSAQSPSGFDGLKQEVGAGIPQNMATIREQSTDLRTHMDNTGGAIRELANKTAPAAAADRVVSTVADVGKSAYEALPKPAQKIVNDTAPQIAEAGGNVLVAPAAVAMGTIKTIADWFDGKPTNPIENIQHAAEQGKKSLNQLGEAALPSDGSSIDDLEKRVHGDSNHQATVRMTNEGREVSYPSGEIKTGGDRNWRNNNPGNLEAGKFTEKHGAIGDDGRFAIFPTMEAGEHAQEALLRGKYADYTINDMVYKYAPPVENDTGQYIKTIIPENTTAQTKISDLSDEQFSELVGKMRAHEGMKSGKLTR